MERKVSWWKIPFIFVVSIGRHIISVITGKEK